MSTERTLVAGRFRRRRLIIVLTAVLATLILTTAGVLVAVFGEFAEEELSLSEEPPPPGLAEFQAIPFEPAPVAPKQPEPIPVDDTAQGGSSPEGPCPGLLDDGLVFAPNPVKLNYGSKGYLDIRNCDTKTVSWTASTVGWVSLAQTGGSLDSGAVFRLLFTVDTSSLAVGQYSFVITVNGVGVAVTGAKNTGVIVAPGVTPSPVPTIGGIIAPGVSPCATQCITRAQLSTLPGRSDVSIDIRTNTPAQLVVMVDADAPAHDSHGQPYYSDPEHRFETGNRRSEWTTTLQPLQPDTKYHIVVAARDAQDGVSFREGTFRTPKVSNDLAAGEPGGCSIECVSHAVLVPLIGQSGVEVDVRTLVPTQLRVKVDGVEVAGSDTDYVTDWNTTIALDPGRTFDIILQATDEQGRTRQHLATVTTPAAHGRGRVMLTFLAITVTNDADDTFGNRKGELTFRFEVNGERRPQLDTGEHRIRSVSRLELNDGDSIPGRSVVIDDAPDQIPIRVQGQERDGVKLFKFCSDGSPFFAETSGRQKLDCEELEWNTAEGFVEPHPQPGGLPGCSLPTGFVGDECLLFAAGGEDPTFQVEVAVTLLDD